MRGVVVAAALLMSLAMSGCFVAKDDPNTASTDDTGDGAGGADSAASGTGTGGPKSSTSGTGSPGSTAGTKGSPPVIVNFTTNATGLEVVFNITATDADNDTVTWVISFGDNATANGTLALVASNLTGSATHAYAAPGDFNATLTVTDGTSSVNRTLAVTVAPAAGGTQDPIHLTGSVQCLPTVLVNGHRGGGASSFDVLPGQGTLTLTLSYQDGDFNDLDMTVTSPGGKAKASEEAGPEPPMTLPAEAGTWNVAVKGYSCVNSLSYTIDVVFS